MKQKVHILYGVFSGNRSGAQLESALRSAGFEIAREAHKADIIMAHSAGCFWLPETSTNQKFMLIDPPYWPGKTIRERTRSRSSNNWHFRQFGYHFRPWIVRNILGVYYAVRDFRRTLRILRFAPDYNLVEAIRNHNVLLVRNQDDEWCTPEIDGLKHVNPKLKFVEIPGGHEDITHHPERYAELLQSFVKGEK